MTTRESDGLESETLRIYRTDPRRALAQIGLGDLILKLLGAGFMGPQIKSNNYFQIWRPSTSLAKNIRQTTFTEKRTSSTFDTKECESIDSCNAPLSAASGRDNSLPSPYR